jgi:hypothetical protein
MISGILPHLHGLSLLAIEARISRTETITEFQNVLATINDNLQKSIQPLPSTSAPLSQHPLNAVQTATFPHGPQREKQQLLPPSPELKQKRKTSHAIM